MERYISENSSPLEIALNEAGFTVQETVKRGKKTVITVIQKPLHGEEQRGEKRLGKKWDGRRNALYLVLWLLSRSILSMITILFCFSCTSGAEPSPPPPWFLNVQSVYPRNFYITGRGDGSTRQDAEVKALAEIALYFVRETTVERSRRAVWSEQDGVVSAESQTMENILVESHTGLVAVRYVKDPWFNHATKSWETLAYIERNEAWPLYEPLAKRQADSFLSLVKAADEENEPFNAVLRYGAAAAYAHSAEFNAVRDFSQVLYPEQANNFFVQTDLALAKLVEKQLLSREKSVISIYCPLDHEQMIYQAMVKALGASGFAIENNRNTGLVCEINVAEGMQQLDSGTMFYPSLTATIRGNSGAMMSFRVSGERAGAINPTVAKRRAYVSLAAALEDAFDRELLRWQVALVK